MSIVRGLSNIRQTVESRGGRANWLSLKDGDSVKIRFLQELDESAENYNEEAGLGFLVLMHRHPVNYKKRAVCTADEGRCYGCEQDWNQRQELFINVLVEDDNGDEQVKILNQAVGKSSIVSWLLEYAGDAGSITDLPFRIKRTGAKLDTTYTLTPAGKALPPIDFDSIELFDLESVLNEVPYEKQEDFYEENDREPATAGAGSSSSSDEVW